MKHTIKEIVEYQPLITDPAFRREPNILKLIEDYYKDHDMENWEELRDKYIKELGKVEEL